MIEDNIKKVIALPLLTSRFRRWNLAWDGYCWYARQQSKRPDGRKNR